MASTIFRMIQVATAQKTATATHAVELGQDLAAIAVDQADRLALGDVVDQPGGEHADQDRAQDAADAVHAEDIERIVVAQPGLQHDRGPVADRAGGQRRSPCAAHGST